MKLEKIYSKYKTIMQIDDQEKRDLKLSELMIEIKNNYAIPRHYDSSWEKRNLAIMAIYRRISLSRWGISTE